MWVVMNEEGVSRLVVASFKLCSEQQRKTEVLEPRLEHGAIRKQNRTANLSEVTCAVIFWFTGCVEIKGDSLLQVARQQ